jgi:CubicO group peptidase (beta-lactamase class C family)
MTRAGFTKAGLARLGEVMDRHVATGGVPGLAWAVARGDDVHVGAAGSSEPRGGTPVADDTIFRIASMTKPVTAVAALMLVEECRLRLDDPVDELLPELADRRVLQNPEGPLEETVPAQRAITLRDLLTFRLGLGLDFERWDRPQPVLARSAELGLGAGPPAPQGVPEPDEWMRRIGTLPLSYQPGERWLYHVGSEVTGVLVARAAGQPFEDFLRERIFEPLQMTDTGFFVPPGKLDRFGPCWFTDAGADAMYDPTDGQWSTPPAFPSGGGGLVSTAADFLAFGQMLLSGGTAGGHRLLSRASIDAMVTPHVTVGPSPGGDVGWGFGVGVQLRRTGPARSVGTYGWDGGLGSSWANDPVEGLVGVLLTNQMFTSPAAPPVVQDFWTCVASALDG